MINTTDLYLTQAAALKFLKSTKRGYTFFLRLHTDLTIVDDAGAPTDRYIPDALYMTVKVTKQVFVALVARDTMLPRFEDRNARLRISQCDYVGADGAPDGGGAYYYG